MKVLICFSFFFLFSCGGPAKKRNPKFLKGNEILNYHERLIESYLKIEGVPKALKKIQSRSFQNELSNLSYKLCEEHFFDGKKIQGEGEKTLLRRENKEKILGCEKYFSKVLGQCFQNKIKNKKNRLQKCVYLEKSKNQLTWGSLTRPSRKRLPSSEDDYSGRERHEGVKRCELLKDDCDFYLCQEKLRQCGDNEYLVNYGYHYCHQFLWANPKLFSRAAYKWLGRVRNCLMKQIDLIPMSTNCQELSREAFTSHIPCYINTGFCQLDFVDKLNISTHVLESFGDAEVLVSGMEIISRCARRNWWY